MRCTREHTGTNGTLNILVIGTSNTGKTSLSLALQKQPFREGTGKSNGLSFSRKDMSIDGQTVHVCLWEVRTEDIALLAAVHVRFHFALFCFEASCFRTFKAVKIVEGIRNTQWFVGTQFVLTACKTDSLLMLSSGEKKAYTNEILRAAAKHDIPLVFTSARSGLNISALMASMVDGVGTRGTPIEEVIKTKRLGKI